MGVGNEAKTQTNRARHYWARIQGSTGRAKLRESTDYIKALLARHPDSVVEEAVERIERLVGAPTREEVRR